MIDSLKLWCQRLLATATLCALAACGSGGGGDDTPAAPTTPVVPAAPVITTQPADTQVTAGTAASFSVVAQGSDLGYQWQRSTDAGTTWVAIAGATSATYTLASPVIGDSDSRFRVVVSRSTATTLSSAARLSVQAVVTPPSITVQLQPVTAYVGADASFSVTATGTSLAYRWQTRRVGADWVDVAQATQATLQVQGLTTADDQMAVRVVVSNSAGSVTSDPITLTVQPAPAAPLVTSQPAAATVVAPATATFSVTLTGNPAPTLQWQRSSSAGSSAYSDIAGATGTSYTTPATTVPDSGFTYRVVARNASGSVNSDAALLTVTSTATAPTVRMIPPNGTAVANRPYSLYATVTGTPAPSVQWQMSTNGGNTFTNINGATQPTLTFIPTLADNLNSYRVTASNVAGTSTSLSWTLGVTAQASNTSGRVWLPGQSLESSDHPVLYQASAMDDQGTLSVIFSQSDGTRTTLYARRGVRGASGAVWSAPAIIDSTSAPVDANTAVSLVTSPNGNLLASWNVRGACTASTYFTPPSTCNYLVTARYLQASNTWQAPMLLSDSPQPTVNARINDAGDVAAIFTGWVRANGTAYTSLGGVAWLGATQTAWQGRTYRLDTGAESFAPAALAIDGSGVFHVFGTGLSAASSNTDVVVLRGQASSGMVSRQVLDSYAATPTVSNAWANPAGAVVALWQGIHAGNTTGRATGSAGALDAGSSTWQVTETGLPFVTGYAVNATVTDEGEFIAHSLGRCASLRRTGGTWAAEQALPQALCNSTSPNYSLMATARNGDFLVLDTYESAGRWLTYNARLRTQTDSYTTAGEAAGYLLYFYPLPPGTVWLSSSGVGGYVSLNTYDTLPTRANGGGSTRGIVSLWGWTLQ